MKTTKSLFLTLAAALFATFAFSQTYTTTLIGSNVATTAHNFGSNGTYTFADNVTPGAGNGFCAVCHTPHNGGTTLPLWDHATTGSTFQTYDSPTLDGDFTAISGASALCLGCHDGTANMDNYGKTETTGTTIAMGAVPGNFGTDLRDDHPISISYPADAATAAAQQMVDPAALLVADGNYLWAGNVECASCHSLHNPGVAQKLLRTSNDNSALCLACHVK